MEDLRIERSDSGNEDFGILVIELDTELAERNGESNEFFARFNKTDSIRNVVIAYKGSRPVGCGAIKHFEDLTMEIKRMYVLPEFRGKGIAAMILKELENWADELGYKRCILETGKMMPEAVALYRKSSYLVIPNFGQYKEVKSSICFAKDLKKRLDEDFPNRTD